MASKAVVIFKEIVPIGCIECTSTKFCQALFNWGPYRRLRLRLHFPDTYPNELVLIELTSDVLPDQVIKRMTKQLDKCALELQGKDQVRAVLELMMESMQLNKFLYAFDEVKIIQTMCAGHGSVQILQRKGKVKLALTHEKYSINYTLTINDDYPDSGVGIKAGKSTFHEKIVFMHTAQANEISRRCMLGYTAEQALAASNPIPKPLVSKEDANQPKMTAGYLRDLKADVRFLKEAVDLKEVNTKKGGAGRGGHLHDTGVRRAARRELKSRSKEEMAKENAAMAALALDVESDGKPSGNASKSLVPVVEFLLNRYLLRLSAESCPACEKSVLPADPALAMEFATTKSKSRPERVFCGHWYHWGCLEEWMSTPPFGKVCPLCSQIVHHPDWTTDVKKLEKRWANEQNKERELDEVSDCFDLGDEFKK